MKTDPKSKPLLPFCHKCMHPCTHHQCCPPHVTVLYHVWSAQVKCECVCPYWFSVFWSGGDHWWGLSLIFIIVLRYSCYGRRLRHSLGDLCGAIGREGAKGQTHHCPFRSQVLQGPSLQSLSQHVVVLNSPAKSSLLHFMHFSYFISCFSCCPLIVTVYV